MSDIIIPKPFQPLRIAFDVDDTLIVPPEATDLDHDMPNWEIIGVYRFLQAQGHHMIVWSGGGEVYAASWANRLFLEPDECRAKGPALDIDIAFDDSDVSSLIPNGKLVRVRRMANHIKRTTRGIERA